jgi:hypothetical protein
MAASCVVIAVEGLSVHDPCQCARAREMFPDYDPIIGKARAVRHGPRRRRYCVLPRNTPQAPPPAVALQLLRARLLLSLQPLKLL